MKWAYPSPGIVDRRSADVPATRDARGSQNVSAADDFNGDLLVKVMSEAEDVVLIATHDVAVVPNSTVHRKRMGGNTQLLGRAINLVDVAAKFCVSFANAPQREYSAAPFLIGHLDALRCIRAVATIMRRLVTDAMGTYCSGSGLPVPTEEEDLRAVECKGLCFDALCPGATVRRRVLQSRCLRMTAYEFTKLHADSRGRGGRDAASTEERDKDMDAAQSDLENQPGVFAL
ncbi:hypothetical protein BWQ96_08698 [Gracilariopsis chorda]|uniref:Uncharacterized protein n=1 Tax=Gracilariopsis chorda TaxID=448386 RepID=A0A2V3IHL2_9FLOR|nr:hypothetical protein BWQ96_08698 [Gracilariopsis chorda]|eukprot:PXF41584.1 hypothetical protein BWQ96_08698 [Gracilariopsis chorda]